MIIISKKEHKEKEYRLIIGLPDDYTDYYTLEKTLDNIISTYLSTKKISIISNGKNTLDELYATYRNYEYVLYPINYNYNNKRGIYADNYAVLTNNSDGLYAIHHKETELLITIASGKKLDCWIEL